MLCSEARPVEWQGKKAAVQARTPARGQLCFTRFSLLTCYECFPFLPLRGLSAALASAAGFASGLRPRPCVWLHQHRYHRRAGQRRGAARLTRDPGRVSAHVRGVQDSCHPPGAAWRARGDGPVHAAARPHWRVAHCHRRMRPAAPPGPPAPERRPTAAPGRNRTDCQMGAGRESEPAPPRAGGRPAHRRGERLSLTKGNRAHLRGTNLKHDLPAPDQGLFFVKNHRRQRPVRVEKLKKNTPSEQLFAGPATRPAGNYQLDVRTKVKGRTQLEKAVLKKSSLWLNKGHCHLCERSSRLVQHKSLVFTYE